MNIATGSVINMTPTNAPWEIAFDIGGETDVVVCPVIGWATVVQARLKDGTIHTELKPAFVWGDMVWTESELREHTPTLGAITLRHPTLPATSGPSIEMKGAGSPVTASLIEGVPSQRR